MSYFNHSCVPNCFKFFIKDQAFVRTVEDIKKDDELFVNYVANEQNFFNLKGRTHQLQQYFPKCLCPLCMYQQSEEYVSY